MKKVGLGLAFIEMTSWMLFFSLIALFVIDSDTSNDTYWQLWHVTLNDYRNTVALKTMENNLNNTNKAFYRINIKIMFKSYLLWSFLTFYVSLSLSAFIK